MILKGFDGPERTGDNEHERPGDHKFDTTTNLINKTGMTLMILFDKVVLQAEP